VLEREVEDGAFGAPEDDAAPEPVPEVEEPCGGAVEGIDDEPDDDARGRVMEVAAEELLEVACRAGRRCDGGIAQAKVNVYRARRRLVDALSPCRGGSPT
jgi:hypothetical protein